MTVNALAESTRYRHFSDLPQDSLVRRENWPEWARSIAGNFGGLEALITLQEESDRQLYYLGTPDIPEAVTTTDSSGRYFIEQGGAKITLLGDPRAAIMRAIINRVGMAGLPNVDDRCWSGWFQRSLPDGSERLQTITTYDMVRQAHDVPGYGYVAVFARGTLEDAGLQITELPEKPHEIHVYASRQETPVVLRPELVVPINGNYDLPFDIAYLGGPDGSPTRPEAARIYDALSSGQGVPHDLRHYRLGSLLVGPCSSVDELPTLL